MSLDFSLVYDADFLGAKEDVEVVDLNITHNLGKMAKAAGVYDCLWRSGENDFEVAEQIIPILQSAIKDMEERPDYYKKFNHPSGWGDYDDFVPWLKDLLKSCENHPKSEIISCV